MARRIVRPISIGEEKLVKLLIGHNDPEQRKRGLQKLCCLYEQGARFSNSRPIALALNGLLFSQPRKIRRWALRAISLIRDKAINLEAITALMPKVVDDPEVLSWAVAAIFAIAPEGEARELLKNQGIPLSGALLLASAQYANDLKRTLVHHKVNIDNDTALELRLASLLLGFDIAPEHMFSGHFQNNAVVGQLNCHPDSLVAQYSVWAIRENSSLGISNLGFPLKDIESRPPNVRNWTYQLVSRNSGSFDEHLDLLECAAFDEESKAREGMAIGIRERWVDGMDCIVVDWAARESDPTTKSYLYEHMAAQSDQSTAYSGIIQQAYVDDKNNSLQRTQLEVAASGTALFSKMQRIQIEERRQKDMFALLGDTASNSSIQQIFNTSGGSISIGANAPNGDIAVNSQQTLLQTSIALSTKLDETLDFVRALEIETSIRQNAEKAIEEATQNKTPGKIQKVIEALKTIKDVAVYSEQTISAVTKLIEFFNKWCN
jgi:hypothetical protein